MMFRSLAGTYAMRVSKTQLVTEQVVMRTNMGTLRMCAKAVKGGVLKLSSLSIPAACAAYHSLDANQHMRVIGESPRESSNAV